MKGAATLILLALVAPPASAKPVLRPTAWSMCGDAPSWTKLKKCLERFGEVKVARTFERLKVLNLGENAMNTPAPGLYVYYAQRGSSLHLVWMSQSASGGKVELLDVRKVSVAGRSGYRLDMRSVDPVVMFDDQTALEATMRQKTAAFCLGTEMACSHVIESCDVLVGGKAYYTFRGTLSIDGGTAVVTGDRSLAGMCTTIERTPLVAGAQ